MIARRQLMIYAAVVAAGLSAPAWAAAPAPFSPQQFENAKAAGPVVVHVNATWCPTCMAQKPTLAALLDDKRFASFKAFQLDYDSGKAVMRELAAPDRSTIIVFKGGKEVARSVGDVRQAAIEALLSKAL